MPENMFATVHLTHDELAFLQELFESQIAVTLKTVQIVAQLKSKIMELPTSPPKEFGTS